MTRAAAAAAAAAARVVTIRRLSTRHLCWVSVFSLGVAIVASLGIGSRAIDPITMLAALAPGGDEEIRRLLLEIRWPRTVLGLIAGAALAVAGAVAQGVTRNPIADPGLLGINAGASLAVVCAITWMGSSVSSSSVWFAIIGGLVAAVLVFGIGQVGPASRSPFTITLVGAAVSAVAGSLVTLVVLSFSGTLAQFRLWQVGSLAGRGLEQALPAGIIITAGLVIGMMLCGALNLLSLGDDVASSLGVRSGRTRILALAAVVALSAGATALVGPIVFIGLIAPHAARVLVGGNHFFLLPHSALLGAAILLLADVTGRTIAPPGEIEAGIMVAAIGAPMMIVLVRRRVAVS